MSYVTPDQIRMAKAVDLLTYLRKCEPDELIPLSANSYCTRSHDSLKISNGLWCWFSRGIGGRSALDYLVKVRGYSFTQAVEAVLDQTPKAAFAPKPQQPLAPRTLLLPEPNTDAKVVTRYLEKRGIHRSIIDYCLANKLLYEAKHYHNAVFVGYDREGAARYAALRGTSGSYKGEATGSDKRYSFAIAQDDNAECVHVFESAIDLLSHATLEMMDGRDWQRHVLLSLAGVFSSKREGVVPVSLGRFLGDYPGVRTICLHLDNDEIGRKAAAGIAAGLADRYDVRDLQPNAGKDVNELLLLRIGQERRKEVHEL